MKVSYNFNDLFHVQKSPAKEPFVELPDFDDAFDTESLRKFYAERESTQSQTCYTPQKEDSLFDELDLEKQNFASAPLTRFLSNSNFETFGVDPIQKLSFNTRAQSEIQLPMREFPIMNEVNFGFESAPVAPVVTKRVSEGMQIHMKNGNMIVNKNCSVGVGETQQRPNHIFNVFRSTSLGHNTSRQSEMVLQASHLPKKQQVLKNVEDEVDFDFNRKLKAKRIFKIQRQTTLDTGKTLENMKKKASSPKKSAKPAKEQVVRSQTSNGNSIVFNFNTDKKSNKTN